MDNISETRLNEVHPALAALIRKLHDMLAPEFEIRVTQGLRSWSEQATLYAQGRTTPGKIITNAPPGTSWHNYGLAVDVVPMTVGTNQPDWDVSHSDWQRIHAVAQSLGLVCGADFRTFKDWPHLQLTGRFPASPSDEVKQLFHDGGILAVWQESGLEKENV